MHSYSSKDFGSVVTRRVKSSMMHVIDMLKGRISTKAKKTNKAHRSNSTPLPVRTKPVLSRKLTVEEINDAELALKRLQAEKLRLEEILNQASEDHLAHRHECSSISSASSNNNVRRENVKVPRYQQKVAFMMHSVFTDEECVELLSELRATGEEVKSTASNEVITTHSESMAQRLWPILEKEVPEYLMGNKLIGLSNRCTFETQSKGYSHKPYMDEAYEPMEGKEKSFLSVYVFLNDDYTGGQSSFLKNWQPSAHDVQVKPTIGSVFVHQHNLLHEVTPVLSGSKHTVRFDVMYNTEKRDVLADLTD